jgi:hypothetical protein
MGGSHWRVFARLPAKALPHFFEIFAFIPLQVMSVRFIAVLLLHHTQW